MGTFSLDEDEAEERVQIKNYRPQGFRYKEKPTPVQPVSKSEASRLVPDQPMGRVVNTYSREWLRECLARHIAKLPTSKAEAFLEGYKAKHSVLAYRQLCEDVREVQNLGFLKEAQPDDDTHQKFRSLPIKLKSS
jgi:hypothetical protein